MNFKIPNFEKITVTKDSFYDCYEKTDFIMDYTELYESLIVLLTSNKEKIVMYMGKEDCSIMKVGGKCFKEPCSVKVNINMKVNELIELNMNDIEN
mmetsp:Transcript_10123/g.8642  ORF Transcript_10123/g.8642 Transcript_10123/m.8642 type:complete len:96 (-) Transcript_10123:243-530(-)